MNDDPGSPSTPSRSWIERLIEAFGQQKPQTRDDLIQRLRQANNQGLIDVDSLEMIEGVMQVSHLRVRDIMIPRAQMVVVERQDSIQGMLPPIIESAHSRFPVIGDDLDQVLGILLAKDLLRYAFNSENEFNLGDIMRPPVFVPESKRLDVLLKEFRSNRYHMAVVVDEYGGVAGLVTIEDVLEQIVGEIEDEHDVDDEHYIMQYEDGRYTVKAITPIEEFNQFFDCQFKDDEFDTVGGLVMQAFGRVPKRGDSTQLGDFDFKILHADNRRIRLMQMSRHSS